MIKIGNKEINEGCFFIAEAGVNHNGSINLAKKLIDAAKDAGADAVKFQTFKSENVVTKDAPMASYQEKNTGEVKTQQEMIKAFELNYDDFIELKKYSDKKGIMFLSTPHSDDAIDFLDSLVPAFKLGSGDLTNLPFLRKVANKNKLIILSTGMATLEEIATAVETIRSSNNKEIILLHCTTSYPCPYGDVNMNAMITIKEKFPNIPVGYSDHTLGIDVLKIAAKHGAVVLEKHFTLDKTLPGPDHKASLDKSELKLAVNDIKSSNFEVKINEDLVMGNHDKKPTKAEIKIAMIVRKSIVAREDIPANIKISSDMVIIKRPGTGIKPADVDMVVGRVTKNSIKVDSLITWDDLL